MPAHTVGEMIAKLSKFDPNLPLLVDGYEFNLRDPNEPILMKVEFNVHQENGYSGKHEPADNPDDGEDAVVIGREHD